MGVSPVHSRLLPLAHGRDGHATHMRHNLRRLAFVLLSFAATEAGAANRIAAVDASLDRATRFLVVHQHPDGAWRSGVHGSFRDGPSLTPHVLSTLFYLSREGDASRAAFRRGAKYVASLIDGEENPALHFPVYTAAEASWVAILHERSPANLRTQQAWLAYLRARQLSRELGWDDDDVEFGGWGYAPVVPRKPGANEARHPLVSSNLSATVFAIGAFRAAHARPDDPVLRDALRFVLRCQNYSDDPNARDDRFDDGGFFFTPDDPATNKAGPAGVDRFGRARFHSYGGMTCDGVRALLACGLPHDHPRVVAARRWIERNFTVEMNPGTFAPDREPLRDATYYYCCWSLAHALARLNVREIDTPRGNVRWAEVLADELMRRQAPDGAWRNRLSDGREDDPLVATPFAAAALAICRDQIGAR